MHFWVHQRGLGEILNCLPAFSEKFGPLEYVRGFMGRFDHAFNTVHRHPVLGFRAPVDAHFGMPGHVDDQRLTVLGQIWAEHSEWFSKYWLPKKNADV